MSKFEGYGLFSSFGHAVRQTSNELSRRSVSKITKSNIDLSHSQPFHFGGSIDSQDVSNLGTNILNNTTEVLGNLPGIGPEVGQAIKASQAISGLVLSLLPKAKTKESALHYEETGQTGYETDLLAAGAGHGINLNGNFNDAINFEVMRTEAHQKYNYAQHQAKINYLKHEFLEQPLPGVVFAMPKRNDPLVVQKILDYINMGWMGDDNIDKYQEWSAIPADKPRQVPGTQTFEVGDNPPQLYISKN
jgi:hypothetical protein